MTEYYMNIRFFEQPSVRDAIELAYDIGKTVDLLCNNEVTKRDIHAKHIEYDSTSKTLRLKVLSNGAQFYITGKKDGVYTAQKII